MRYLVYLLLLANLGVFAWLYTHQDDYRPTAPAAERFPSSVESLVLLSERGSRPSEGEQNHPAPAAAPAPQPVPEPASEPEMDVPLVGEAALPEDASAPVDDEPVGAAETDQASADENVEPMPESAMEQVSAQPVAEAEPPAPLPRVCQTIGPFPGRGEADAFISKLEALDQSPVLRTAQVEQPSGYWVYLPSMPRAKARRTIDELAAKGVKDYFLGRQNYISLGIFSDKRTAEDRVREISGLGYQPLLEPRFVTREVYWLDFEERGPVYINADQWRALLNDQPDLRRQSLTCE